MRSENGSVSTNILLVFTVILFVVLGYILLNKDSVTDNVTSSGTVAAHLSYNTDTKRPERTFSDGLTTPQNSENFALDETGAGVSVKDVFNIDINNDGQVDRIVRTRNESGTAHYWDEYRIEINNNGVFFNVAPDGLRTTQGAECALQKIQFIFEPEFKVIKISRPWENTWDTPTVATRTIYELKDNKIIQTSVTKLRSVCDVSELFADEL